MDENTVNMFVLNNSKYLPENQALMLRDRLLSLDDSKKFALMSIQFKDPVTALIFSLFLGQWGVDRFYIGDTGMGVGKLITCGGIGIWSIIDWFLIMDATKQKNLEKLNMLL